MNYKSWNDLIYKFYFRRDCTKRVMFHITLQDLVDFARDENVEIARDKKASEFDDSFIKKDFVCKFWLTVYEGNKSLKDFENKLIQLKNQSIDNDDYKSLLAIVAVLIMPICENDELELHGNNYYGHLLPFLYKNKFISNEEKSCNNLLASIGLDEIWHKINELASSESLQFSSKNVISDNGIRHNVLSLMKESLLSPSKLQKFCILFDKGGLVPKINIENERLLSVFSKYYGNIGISPFNGKLLMGKDFKEYLTAVLRSEYDNWDGTTRIKEHDRISGKIKMESGNTYYPLFLHLDFDANSEQMKFGFQLYCSDVDDMDYMRFISETDGSKFPETYIRSDGYANRPFYLDNKIFNNIFKVNNDIYSIYEENAATMKSRFVVTDYYLMKEYRNRYIATNDFVKGEFYFVIIRHDKLDSFNTWLIANDAKLINESILGSNYSIYSIEHMVEELAQRNNLHFNTDIRCRAVNNLEVKTADQTDIILLSKLMPAMFEITGVDVSKDKIYAVTVDGQRHSSNLEYNHEKNLWILKVFTNLFQLDKRFVIYCNETQIPFGKVYRFSDFILPSSFKELQLDQQGNIDGDIFTAGLRLPNELVNSNLINWNTLKEHMDKAPISKILQSTYKETDFLLYAITSASYETSRWVISMGWIKSIKERITSEFESEDSKPQSDKYALQNALADYFRMGYINYAYTENGLCLTANRPTLILLKPEYERKSISEINGINMVTESCTEKNFKCLLTGGRTISLVKDVERLQSSIGYKMEIKNEDNILMPQTIFIHANDRIIFEELASKLNLLYQDNIYANVMLEKLPSVDEYLKIMLESGKERDLFFVKSFRVIDYLRMEELYVEKLSKGEPIYNSEIDKEHFDNQNEVVTFFPGTREEVSVVIYDGKMIEIDKYWGHFVGMKQSKAKVLQYDRDLVQITMPQQIRLPLLYARALTLLTGNTPKSILGSRTYSIGVNPCTSASASNPYSILKKLGQY